MSWQAHLADKSLLRLGRDGQLLSSRRSQWPVSPPGSQLPLAFPLARKLISCASCTGLKARS